MNKDAKSSGAAIAGMYKFVKPAGRNGIIVRLDAILMYVPLTILLLLAAIPYGLLAFVGKPVTIIPPFPLWIWTGIILLVTLEFILFLQMNKPLIDLDNRIYWPRRFPGVGRPHRVELLKGFYLDTVAEVKVEVPMHVAALFGNCRLLVIFKDGSERLLMLGPEKRMRQNARILCEVMNISAVDNVRNSCRVGRSPERKRAVIILILNAYTSDTAIVVRSLL